MRTKYQGFDVTFSISNISLQEQNQIYQTLMKDLSYELKERLSIEIKDLSGGRHQIMAETGISPDGEKCPKCTLIDCAQCSIWQRLKEKKGT